MRISISERIGLGLLSMILLTIILLIVNSASVGSYQRNTLLLATSALPSSKLLNDLRATKDTIFSESLIYLITGESQHLTRRRQAIALARDTLERVPTASLSGGVQRNTLRTRLGTLSSSFESAIQLTDDLIARRQRGEQLDLVAVTDQLEERNSEVEQGIQNFETALNDEVQQIVAATSENPLLVTRLVAALMLLVGSMVLAILIYTVVRPLRMLRDAALAVAGGDLSRQVRVERRDEIGDLSIAFNTMVVRVAEQQQQLQQQVETTHAARLVAEDARDQIRAQLATIEAQRTVIRAMSVPILPLNPTTLVMPLVGALDSARLLMLQEQALHALARRSIRYLILDITGVPIVDSQVAQGLLQVVQAAALLGTEVLLVGIRPEVAQVMVSLGLRLNGVVTRSTLQDGIDYALARAHR